MSEFDIREVMEQIHISSEMQEEIVKNVQSRMENGKQKTRSRRKTAATAAALLLAAGVASLPVQAVVQNVVRARMERLSKEEVQDIDNMIREHNREADGFSREYSDSENKRCRELWQAYKNGTFPEKDIVQVDSEEQVTEGTLCYVRATGVFYLPEREMTEEEQLEIIDFQHKMSYTVSQGAAAQEERAERQAEKKRLKEIVQAADGISEEEAIEIARKQLESVLGEEAAGMELRTYDDGSGAQIRDISDETSYEHKGDVAYMVNFWNPYVDFSNYIYYIDAMDGSILRGK